MWTQTDAFKVLPTTRPVPVQKAATLSGARGETVDFQIIVTAKHAPLSDVNVTLSNLRDGAGHAIAAATNAQLFREYYIDLTHPSGANGSIGLWPDGLIPIGRDPYYHELRNGAPFTVPARNNQGVWVDVAIPANAPAGIYRGAARVTAGNSTLANVPVALTVWNFTIPATSTLTTAFGFNSWDAYLGHYGDHWNTARIEKLTNLYDSEGLKHRISFYGGDVANPQYTYDPKAHKITSISYALYDSTEVRALDGTLLSSGARWNVADLPNANPAPPGATPGPNDAQYVAFWKVMSTYFQERRWYARNFYYDLDEPSSSADYAIVLHRADVVHEADPGLRVMDTTALRSDLIGHINVWNPIVNELDSPGFPAPFAYAGRQKAGDSVWFYTSNESLSSGGPWPNFFIDRGMNDTRIFTWMAWRYHLNGFLYYSTVNNYSFPNPWTNEYSFGDNGDGTLFYPGRVSLIGGRHDIPCPSIRLKTIRAALQDYEYMELLHAKGQDAFVDALVAKLVVKTNHWTQNPQALEAARAQMAAKIVGD